MEISLWKVRLKCRNRLGLNGITVKLGLGLGLGLNGIMAKELLCVF